MKLNVKQEDEDFFIEVRGGGGGGERYGFRNCWSDERMYEETFQHLKQEEKVKLRTKWSRCQIIWFSGCGSGEKKPHERLRSVQVKVRSLCSSAATGGGFRAKWSCSLNVARSSVWMSSNTLWWTTSDCRQKVKHGVYPAAARPDPPADKPRPFRVSPD